MAAAAPTEGFMEFEYSDAGFCNGGRHKGIPAIKHGHPFKLEVFCVNLENELREHFSDMLTQLKFIKVDTEGYDLYVLESMVETLSKLTNRLLRQRSSKEPPADTAKNFFHFFWILITLCIR